MNQQAKFNMITDKTLVVGIDIAKHKHWARCHNYRGEPITKPFPFQNNKYGFQSLLQKLENIRIKMKLASIVIGVEPTGHYWKCLAYALKTTNISLVLVNPLHVKRTKELDDNSPTKNDPKDAAVIAKLVKDARFFIPQLPTGIYADLRNLVNQRARIVKKLTRTKLQLYTLLDVYFPEFFTVFKKIEGVLPLAAIKEFPIPADILKLSAEEIKERLKRYTKSSHVTDKLVLKLKQAAEHSIGIVEGLDSYIVESQMLLEEYDFHKKQMEEIERRIEMVLKQIEYSSILLSIRGVGPISLATFLSETGDLRNYKHWKQLRKLGGLNLVEKSSGDKRSGFEISKRGRRKLRAILYMIGLSLVTMNDEFKQIHNNFKTRSVRPLAGNESIVAIISKFLRVAHAMAKKGCTYDPSRIISLPIAA